MNFATISSDQSVFTVMVTFDVEPEQQSTLCEKVREYIDGFIAEQPGFVSANLHKSLCGKHVVNYAQWRSKEDFKAFAAKAKELPVVKELLEYKPRPVFYEVCHSA